MIWSKQQDNALTAVAEWLRDPSSRPIFRLFGYAGSGKSTLAKYFAQMFGGDVKFASFTGKAALVMRRKGCEGASTIHSLIYTPVERDDGHFDFELNPESELASADLLIVDECSMVGDDLGRDVMSFGVPVLVLGDPAQLPPVKGAGFFTAVDKPDVMLTEIHRQAFDNPIIRMATAVRQGERLTLGEHFGPNGVKSRVLARADLVQSMVMKADQVLVGTNRTRMGTNAKMRAILGLPSDRPVEKDKVICLRNNREKNLLNGGIWNVEAAQMTKHETSSFEVVDLMVAPPPEDAGAAKQIVKVPMSFFETGECTLPPRVRRMFDEFTYGYAITVHKSQGSQWDHVTVFDESFSFGKMIESHSGADKGETFRRQWTYTAITRSAESVTVVQPDWYFQKRRTET